MDLNVRAFRVVQAALSSDCTPPTTKKIAASKGGQAGGPARALALTAKRRTEIARKASRARWSKKNGH